MCDTADLVLGSMPSATAIHFQSLFDLEFSRRCRVQVANGFATVTVNADWPLPERKRMRIFFRAFVAGYNFCLLTRGTISHERATEPAAKPPAPGACQV